MQANEKDYYIGADIGTDSVGWAVTDTEYRLKKFKGNAMWGVRLLDESNTAEERRGFRTAVRRSKRKRDRIEWLQSLFAEEIAKVDISFFQRLKESNLYLEDKSAAVPYAVFADEDFTDKDYHRLYPTIYHLRKDLIENGDPHDVRLVYLALHHLIKHRGHFLFESLSSEEVNSFEIVLESLNETLSDELGFCLESEDISAFGEALKSKQLNKTAKYNRLLALCDVNKKEEPQKAEAIALLSGKIGKLSVLFADPSIDAEEVRKAELGGNYEEKSAEYQSLLGEQFIVIEKLKAVYDWAVLADILDGERYISCAKVKSYEKHRLDLKLLKKYVKERCPEKYNEVFKKSADKLDNYTAYSGMVKKNGRTGVLQNKCTQADFCSFLKKRFKSLSHNGYEEMFSEIENETFMPKQHIKDNGVIPMQVNRMELVAILENAKRYLGFLNQVDESGKSIADKIIDIFSFRIPYYVGPLNTHSDKAWLVRKSGRIVPWNFSEVVDVDQSAETFITNLTSKCTYLPQKDVIPKNSILYCRYMVLNELNNLRINGEKISVGLKQSIFNDLFLKRKKVTQKALKNYLISLGYRDIEITGIDGDFKANMKPYLDLVGFGLTADETERVITAITIFSDDKALLRKRLRVELGAKLSDAEIVKISRLSYSGWGRLSKEFLTEIMGVNPETGELMNIITALWETNDNLMILLGSKYNFSESLAAALMGEEEKSMREIVEAMYLSPKVKRPVYQTLRIMQEIVKIQKKAPKKIFIEVTRYQGVKNKRTVSRKTQLLDLYKAYKKDAAELYAALEGTDEEKLRSDKLFLYYSQMGRCMYTGEQIDLDSLFDSNVYDIDHIFPQSKIKDDSLDNRVLAKKTANAEKGNIYPISDKIRHKQYGYWKMLLDKELISKKKFERLTRAYGFSDDELSDFISRQVVETGQATKAVAQVLKQLYPDMDVVYVKASLASDFRHKYDMLKCREVNDLHHAKDAYLNIVVGNVYDVRFTKNRANFIKDLQRGTVSLNQMFTYDTKGAWIAQDDNSIKIVKQMMRKSKILLTRFSNIKSGTLFDLNPLKKGKGQVPRKGSGPLSDIQKYGGYNNAQTAYFTLIQYHDKKDKDVKALIPIEMVNRSEFEHNPSGYLNNHLGLNNATVLLPVVKVGTCVELNGFRMHIKGKMNNGKYIIYSSAMELILDYAYDRYIKDIGKYLDSLSRRVVPAKHALNPEDNGKLYDALSSKMTDTILRVEYEALGKSLKDQREAFSSLPLENQCKILSEIIKILKCNSVEGDLKYIGIKSTGKLYTNGKLSNIKDVKSYKIINQSITGLYENSYIVI